MLTYYSGGEVVLGIVFIKVLLPTSALAVRFILVSGEANGLPAYPCYFSGWNSTILPGC